MVRQAAGLRILVTGPDIAESGGAGVQQHVRNLVAAFASHETIEIVPFTSTSVAYREPWLRKGLRLLRVYASFPAALRRCDVVHVNSTIDSRSVVRDSGLLLIAAVMKKPAILQFHGGGLHRLSWASNAVLRRLATWPMRTASLVLFLSAAQAEPVIEAFGLSGARIVGNYVDVSGLEPQATHAAPGLRVLFMSRVDASKGVLEAVEGFLAVAEDGWEMRIAGSGPAEAQVRRLAEDEERVTYLGFVDGVEKAALLQWADVLVLPTAHDEGLPYAVLEAAAAGAALVTSTRGALTTVNKDGTTGIVVPERDAAAVGIALAALGGDCRLLESMQNAASGLVCREYSFDTLRAVFAGLYRAAAR